MSAEKERLGLWEHYYGRYVAMCVWGMGRRRRGVGSCGGLAKGKAGVLTLRLAK